MATSQDVIPVKVYVRSRPFNNRENSEHAIPCLTFYIESNQLAISGKTFAFDSVMDPSTSQQKAFEVTTSSLMEKIMKGFNCTILAYGQTGSGKTYTMGTEETTESMTSESRGIIPRLVEQLFEEINKSEFPNAYQVHVSMLEIYDEKVNDLLSSAKDLPVREIQGNVSVTGLTKSSVMDLPATMRQLEIGCQLRSKGETAMNAKSSRSHAIFTITVTKTAMSDMDKSFNAKLHLVDLAGSERLKKTQAEGERMKEGIRINEGLLALGNVISALSEPGGSKHIPYRDSKITRLLQDSLGGNSYTVMIACISPADTNAEETMSTLRYADRAKKIKNKPVVNEDVGQAALLKQLQERIRQLERQIADKGDGTTFECDPDKKVLLEAAEKANQVLLKRQANLMFAKSTLEGQLAKLTEQSKEKDSKILDIAQKWSEVEEDTALKDYLKQIEQLVKISESSESADSSDVDFMNSDECDEENIVNTDYVARQSQLEHEMREIITQIRSKDQLMEKTRSDLEVIQKHEKEKATLTDKVESLQAERDKLLKESKKSAVTGKLAEERRQRVKELEGQINNYKKQLNDYKKLEKQKLECEHKMKKMDDEIHLLKQTRVKLQKAVKEENEKFRAQKLKADRELTQLRAMERKKAIAHGREIQAQQKKLDVMRLKLDESQRALKKFTIAQAKKNTINSAESTRGSIKKFLKEEAYHHLAFMDTEKHSKALIASRGSLYNHVNANKKAMEKLRRELEQGIGNAEDKQNEIDTLQKDIEAYEREIDLLHNAVNILHQKQGEYDENKATEERFKSIQTLSHAKKVLDVAFELIYESMDSYNTLTEKNAEDNKKAQQVKEESFKKSRMYQLKLDEYLKRLEEYRERSNTEHTILAGKLATATTEQDFITLAERFDKIREELAEQAEELAEQVEELEESTVYVKNKRTRRKPTLFGDVRNSEDVIEGTPRQILYKKPSRRTKCSVSPSEDDIAPRRLERRTTDLFKVPSVPLTDSKENLNSTITIESADESNALDITFVCKNNPKRAIAINEGEAPPLKVRHGHDVSLGGIP